MKTRSPASPGDVCALRVGGFWILTEVLTVDPEGMVETVTDRRGLTLHLKNGGDNHTERRIAPRDKVGGAARVHALVEGHANTSFEAVEELSEIVNDGVIPGGAGTQTLLDDLT